MDRTGAHSRKRAQLTTKNDHFGTKKAHIFLTLICGIH